MAKGLWSAVLLLAAAQPSVHAAEQAACAPTATVEGGEPARERVIQELRARGIGTRPVPGCAFASARVAEAEGALVVAIVDAYGRGTRRAANGPAAAATLIESWVRTDLSDALLSTRAVAAPAPGEVEPRAAPIPAPPSAARPTLAMPARTADPHPERKISLTASAETSVATDGSLWLGVTAGLCFRIGPACAGALVRVSNDAATFGESREMRTGRLATDVLLGAGLPIHEGRLTILPGIGVGVGWLRTTALNGMAPSGSDGDVDGGGLRASATTQLSIAVTRSAAIDLGIAADISPVAHTGLFREGSNILAGEPRGFVRGGVGVRLGLP